MKLFRMPLTTAIAAVVLGVAAPYAPAMAQNIGIAIPGFSFSFAPNDVAYAYHDGYWDHGHRWHNWRNERESREFKARYEDRYDDQRHDRVENGGWREDRHGERRDDRRDDEHRNRDRN